MKKPTFAGLTKNQTDYIAHLEGVVNGTNVLVQELNLVSEQIASEIKEMREKGAILEDDKAFEKILKLIDKKSKFEPSTKSISKTKEENKETKKETEEDSENVFEMMVNKAKANAGKP